MIYTNTHTSIYLVLASPVVCSMSGSTKRLEKKLDGNYTRMLRTILNRSWQQHPTRRQLYGHLPPVTKTIQYQWYSIIKSMSDNFLHIPSLDQVDWLLSSAMDTESRFANNGGRSVFARPCEGVHRRTSLIHTQLISWTRR